MAENKKYTKTQELTYELRVKDVMNRTVVAVSPKTTINELREIFRDNRISGTPVEDKGKLIGIISIEDVINCLSEGEMDAIVADKMSTNVEVLRPDEPLVHAVVNLINLDLVVFL